MLLYKKLLLMTFGTTLVLRHETYHSTPRPSVVDTAAVGVRTIHSAASLHDSLYHSKLYWNSSQLHALHHLPASSPGTNCYILPLLRYQPTIPPLYTLTVIYHKMFKLQIYRLKNKISRISTDCMKSESSFEYIQICKSYISSSADSPPSFLILIFFIP